MKATSDPENGPELSLVRVKAPVLDLTKTLHSGQVFHWLPYRDGYAGAIGEVATWIAQDGSDLLISSPAVDLVKNYLALDHPIAEIIASFPKDPAMSAAVAFSAGIRVLRQPPWECLATFITSSLKQVQHIRAISLMLRQRLGRTLKVGGIEVHSYPEPEILADADLNLLTACKLGYRARHLLATARLVASGDFDLSQMRRLPTSELRKRLCDLPGVGEKIANCVILFAYERLDAFPIDVWIRRVLVERYFGTKPKVNDRELNAFSANYFGPYAGYAQQYLFHHWRLTYRKKQ